MFYHYHLIIICEFRYHLIIWYYHENIIVIFILTLVVAFIVVFGFNYLLLCNSQHQFNYY